MVGVVLQYGVVEYCPNKTERIRFAAKFKASCLFTTKPCMSLFWPNSRRCMLRMAQTPGCPKSIHRSHMFISTRDPFHLISGEWFRRASFDQFGASSMLTLGPAMRLARTLYP